MATHPRKVFSLHKSLSQVPEEFQKKLYSKLETIKNHLKDRYNIVLRDDSRLTWIYLTQMDEFNMERVCREIWYNTLVYRYTDYEKQCQETIPKIKKQIIRKFKHPNHPLALQATHEYIQYFVLPVLQMSCMKKIMDESKMFLEKTT